VREDRLSELDWGVVSHKLRETDLVVDNEEGLVDRLALMFEKQG